MAAKDYVFVTGWRDAYLAKKKKSNSPLISAICYAAIAPALKYRRIHEPSIK